MTGVPQLHVHPTRHMASLTEVEETMVETDCKRFSNKK